MKFLIALFIVLFFLGCTTVPPDPENGPPEPEPVPGPVPGPAPEPEPGEGRVMGYPPGPSGKCSSRAAHDRPLSMTGLCYNQADLEQWCLTYRYRANTEGACMAIGAGYDH